jgi:hypothetical protein
LYRWRLYFLLNKVGQCRACISGDRPGGPREGPARGAKCLASLGNWRQSMVAPVALDLMQYCVLDARVLLFLPFFKLLACQHLVSSRIENRAALRKFVSSPDWTRLQHQCHLAET